MGSLWLCIYALFLCNVCSMPVTEKLTTQPCHIDESAFQAEFDRKLFIGKWYIDHAAGATYVGKWKAKYAELLGKGGVHYVDEEQGINITGTLSHTEGMAPTEYLYKDDTHSSLVHVVSTDYNIAIVYESLLSEKDTEGDIGDSDVYVLSRDTELTEAQRTESYALMKDLQTALCLHPHEKKATDEMKSCNKSNFPIQENFDMNQITTIQKWFIVREGNLVGKWRADHVVFTPNMETGGTDVSFHDGGLATYKHAVKVGGFIHSHIDGDFTERSQPGDYTYKDKEHTTRFIFVRTDYLNAFVYEQLLSEPIHTQKTGDGALYWISKTAEHTDEERQSIKNSMKMYASALCLAEVKDCNVSNLPIQADFDLEQFLTEEKWYVVDDGEAKIGKWRADHIIFSRKDNGVLHMSFHDGGLVTGEHSVEIEHRHVDGEFLVGDRPGDYFYRDDTHLTHMRFVWTDYSNALIYEQLVSENGVHVSNVGDAALYHISKTVERTDTQTEKIHNMADQLYEPLCITPPPEKTCRVSDFQTPSEFDADKFSGKWYIVHDKRSRHLGKWRADHLVIDKDGVKIEFQGGPLDNEHYVKGELGSVEGFVPGDYIYTDSTHSSRLRVLQTDYNTAFVYERLIESKDGLGLPGDSDAYYLSRKRELSDEETAHIETSWTTLIPELCLNHHLAVKAEGEPCNPEIVPHADFDTTKFLGEWYILHGNHEHVGKWRADHLAFKDIEDGLHIEFHDGPLDVKHYVKGGLQLVAGQPGNYKYTDNTHSSFIRVIWTDYNNAIVYETLIESKDGVGKAGDEDAYFISRHRDPTVEDREMMIWHWNTLSINMCLSGHVSEQVPEETCEVDPLFHEDFDINKFLGKWYIAQLDSVHVGKWRADHVVITSEDGLKIEFHGGPLDAEHYVKGSLEEKSTAEYTYSDDTHTTQFRIVFTNYDNRAFIYERLINAHDGLGNYGDSDAYYITRSGEPSDEDTALMKGYMAEWTPKLCLTKHMKVEQKEETCEVDPLFHEDFDINKFLGKWYIAQLDSVHVGKWRADHVVITSEDGLKIEFHGGPLDAEHYVKGSLEEKSTAEYTYSDDTHTTQFRIVFTNYDNRAFIYERLINAHDGLGNYGDSDAYYITRSREPSDEDTALMKGYMAEWTPKLCLTKHMKVEQKEETCEVDPLFHEDFDINKFLGKWYIAQLDSVHVGKWRADHVVIKNEDGLKMEFQDGPLDVEHYVKGSLEEKSTAEYTYSDDTHTSQLRIVWTNYDTRAFVYERLINAHDGLGNYGDSDAYYITRSREPSDEDTATMKRFMAEWTPKLCLNKHVEVEQKGPTCKPSYQTQDNLEEERLLGKWYIIQENLEHVGKWRADHLVLKNGDGLKIEFQDGPLDTEHYVKGEMKKNSVGHYTYTDSTHTSDFHVVWTDYNTMLVYERLINAHDGLGSYGDSDAYFITRNREPSAEDKAHMKKKWADVAPKFCLTRHVEKIPEKTCDPVHRVQEDFDMSKFTGKWYILQENVVHVGKWRADHLVVKSEEGLKLEFQDGPLDAEHYVTGDLEEESSAEYTFSHPTHTSHIRIVWTDYNIALVYERLISSHDGIGQYGDTDAYYIARHRDLSAEERGQLKSSWADLAPKLCLTRHVETEAKETCKPVHRVQEDFDMDKFLGKWYIAQENVVHVGKWRADHVVIKGGDHLKMEFQDGPLDDEHYVIGDLVEESAAEYTFTHPSHTSHIRIVWTDYNIALVYERLISSHDGLGRYGDTDAYYITRHRDLSAEERGQMKSSWADVAPKLCLTRHVEVEPEGSGDGGSGGSITGYIGSGELGSGDVGSGDLGSGDVRIYAVSSEEGSGETGSGEAGSGHVGSGEAEVSEKEHSGEHPDQTSPVVVGQIVPLEAKNPPH